MLGDSLSGGDGADRFIFTEGGGPDLIKDFTKGDKIDLIAFGDTIDSLEDVQANATEAHGYTVVVVGPTDSVVLENVSLASLQADDFIFG